MGQINKLTREVAFKVFGWLNNEATKEGVESGRITMSGLAKEASQKFGVTVSDCAMRNIIDDMGWAKPRAVANQSRAMEEARVDRLANRVLRLEQRLSALEKDLGNGDQPLPPA